MIKQQGVLVQVVAAAVVRQMLPFMDLFSPQNL